MFDVAVPTGATLTDRYGEGIIALALALVDDLPSHTQRITQTVSPYENCHQHEVSIELILPRTHEPAPTRLLVPLLFVRRDILFDNLEVSGPPDVTLLSRWEDKQLAAQLISAQFDLACKIGDARRDRNHGPLSGLANQLRVELMKSAFNSPGTAKAVLSSVLERIQNEPRIIKSQDELRKLIRLCRFLSSNYLLVADLTASPGERIRVTLLFDSRGDEGTDRKTWKFKLRGMFGQRPFQFHVPLPYARRARSYHFRMRAPGGMYVAEADFVVTGERPTTDGRAEFISYQPSDGEVKDGHARPGLPYVHLYLGQRGLASPDDERARLFAYAKFHEVPPGSIGLATVLQVSVAASLVAFGRYLDFLLTSSTMSTDVPVLFLALPVAMAIWLQPSMEGLDLQRSSVAARIGNLLSGLTSFTAGLTFIVGRAIFANGGPIPTEWKLWWWLIALANCGIAGYLVVRLRRATKAYGEALRRSSQSHIQH